MRALAVTEMGLMLSPESGRIGLPVAALISLIICSVSGLPSWNSIPA